MNATNNATPLDGQVVDSVSLSPAAERAWKEGLTFEEYVDRLLQANLFHDAVRIASAASAPRDLIWWSALCIWAVQGQYLRPAENDALKAAVHWVFDPSLARHAAVADCVGRLPPESAVCAMAAAVRSFGFARTPSEPLSGPNLALGRRAALASIFQTMANSPTVELRRYLASFGLALSKSPNHWSAKSP